MAKSKSKQKALAEAKRLAPITARRDESVWHPILAELHATDLRRLAENFGQLVARRAESLASWRRSDGGEGGGGEWAAGCAVEGVGVRRWSGPDARLTSTRLIARPPIGSPIRPPRQSPGSVLVGDHRA